MTGRLKLYRRGLMCSAAYHLPTMPWMRSPLRQFPLGLYPFGREPVPE